MSEMNNGAVGQKTGGASLEQKKRGKAPLIVVGVVLALAVIGYGAACCLAYTSTTFFPGSAIAGVDIAGLSADMAAETAAAQVLGRESTLILNGEELTFTAGDLGAYDERDIQAAVRSAYADQHTGNIFAGGWVYLRGLLGKNSVTHVLSYNKTAIAGAAAQMKTKFDREPLDASYEVSESGVTVTVARSGREIDQAALAGLLEMAVSLPGQSGSITMNTDPIPAKTLTAQTIHDEIAGEMKNAGYDAATESITPERLGAEFDVSAAQKLLDAADPGATVTIPATIEYPEVTAEELKTVLFRDILGECRTKVGGTTARKTNVRLAAEKVDGYVMNTGDVFSYNGVVGQRTAEAGFQPAPAYVQGETVDEIGGGICQVSSTLYFACLKGNLAITERYAHRYAPSYIERGMDATVSWGGPDYQFTNDTSYPIKIETVYQGNYLTVRLYGTNADGTYARMTHEEISRTDWETEYQEDETIAPGTQQVKTTPYTGYLVKSYRHVYDKEGNLISSALEATSNYKSRNKVVLVAPGELPGAEPKVPTAAPVTPEVQPPAPEAPTVPETPAETAPETPDVPADAPAEIPAEPVEEPEAPTETAETQN